MTKQRGLKIMLAGSCLLWLWAGYRVAAVQSGKLGSITVNLRQLDISHKFVSWSPTVDVYQFSHHQLILAPNSEALFLLNPPRKFRQGKVMVIATGPINVSAEYRQPASAPTDHVATRTFRWSELARFPGGHRLHIKNLTQQPLFVQEIKITFIP